jgi:hypothetical protein
MNPGRRNSPLTEVRKFGLLFGAVGAVLGSYLLWRGNPLWPWAFAAGGAFALTGVVAPGLLRPLYRLWMKLAFALAWINTRVLLGLFFYLVMTPVGLVLRAMGKDLLDERIDRRAPSYWIRREATPFDAERYRRLF